MKASILLVSRNRKVELEKTLNKLEKWIIKNEHEVRIFLDDCTDGSEQLKSKFPWVFWYSSSKNIGASKARNQLYREAEGDILFGFDDDSHPLQSNFIEIAENLFLKNNDVGIISFKEIKGIFASDDDIPTELYKDKEDYFVKDFLGCGFAMKREIYNKTRGFPVWIDIYGEEVCLAIETLELGYDILFTHKIMVNHRTDKQKLNTAGANYFRFGKQLKNTTFFYLVYYPFPLLVKKILRLYFLNFKKYALKNPEFFREYCKSIWRGFVKLKSILQYRKPVSVKTIVKFNNLSNPTY